MIKILCTASRRFFHPVFQRAILCLTLLCILSFLPPPGHCDDVPTFRIMLFVSKNIRPYVEAVEGFHDGLQRAASSDPAVDTDVEIIMLDRYTDASLADLASRMASRTEGRTAIHLAVAVGPEAAAFVWETFPESDIAKLYFLILNPEKVIPDASPATGISLNIPPAEQLRLINQSLSLVTRVGVFYDPVYNADFFAAASAATLELDVELVPLAVGSKKDIPFLLEECWDTIDCVWLIPDRTVISESIAQYIIKQAVLKKVPVVGYNRFFYDSGAAAAFVFDYANLGRQAAGLAVDVLQGRAGGTVSPVFHVWLNASVFQKMGIPLPDPVESPLKVGP